MDKIRITSHDWKNRGTVMHFLTPDIFYPKVSVEELFTDKVTVPMAKARESYQSYLNSVKHNINSKLLKLYMGEAPYLDHEDQKLHDFMIRQLVYDGAAQGSKKGTDHIRLILDAHNGYDYELLFDNLQYFRAENALYEFSTQRSFGEIVLCEIGVIDDIQGCNFISCWTSGGCEFSIWFKKFNYRVIAQKTKE
ncbi:MAG: hypothetical protein ACI3XR_05925 [Eubacteriales bacterium]